MVCACKRLKVRTDMDVLWKLPTRGCGGASRTEEEPLSKKKNAPSNRCLQLLCTAGLTKLVTEEPAVTQSHWAEGGNHIKQKQRLLEWEIIFKKHIFSGRVSTQGTRRRFKHMQWGQRSSSDAHCKRKKKSRKPQCHSTVTVKGSLQSQQELK